MTLPRKIPRVSVQAWTQYSWDPVTEVATFTDEATGQSFEKYQPLLPHVKKGLR